MIVTFISQCEKKSLKKTRRILDAFANRIGSNTWQTLMTQKGLQAVKKLLRKTASKNTAVCCHRIRGRNKTEVVWIVGKRSKFSPEGYVAVNDTKTITTNNEWEHDWQYLPLIKSLTALAALFHDWGKASRLFQEKLDPKNNQQNKGDPLRHEWISTVFLNAYVSGEEDKQWLERLAKGEFDTDKLLNKAMLFCQSSLQERQQDDKDTAKKLPKPLFKRLVAPLSKLPQAASLVAWLVLSHHRLPVKNKKGCIATDSAKSFESIFTRVRQDWGYENYFDKIEFTQDLPRCFDYPDGFPSDSKTWLKEVKKQAQRLLNHLTLLDEAVNNGTIRIILNHSRLALMLGDHYYSSLAADAEDRLPYRELTLHANTDNDGNLKQTLDEHLLGVARQAQKTAQFLPMFEGRHLDELTLDSWYVRDLSALRKPSPSDFKWQDKAVIAITKWRKQNQTLDAHNFGFFTVNMASTGKGKTFANAKIMRALSFDQASLRYILALGLRTLTLQTGTEYRSRIGLTEDQLAVLIGSKAILNLYNNDQKESQTGAFSNGSESAERLLDNDIHFDSPIPQSNLKTLLRRTKDLQFLYAPVLSCTIDHLISATETKRGGRYILPTLRLMSSDLVIDEIDDFTGEDLVAIGRLIHLAGMLGRKVMISSATIPPDLAEGYFNAYQEGWSLFATMRKLSPLIGCAWVDDNTTTVKSIHCQPSDKAIMTYHDLHNDFIIKRTAFLKKDSIKRKANIVRCDIDKSNDDGSRLINYFHSIQKEIEKKHLAHCQTDNTTQKHVSFGAVRIANITPCVELTEYLLNATWSERIDVRIMTYHSRQVLLMRHEQEKHLDQVLKRNPNDDQDIFNHQKIRQHLDQIKKRHVIFIAVVSPVEEVGRDHDWDWAVIEPSSYRSFIQMAGRVLRHRNISPKSPNIALLQYNINGLQGRTPAYCKPGYESKELALKHHRLNQLVDEKLLTKKLDATLRISRRDKKIFDPESNLADLEHESIHRQLSNYQQQGAKSLQGWLDSYWWLTAVPQACISFRKSQPMLMMYLVPDDDGEALYEKDKQGHLAQAPSDEFRGITHQENLSQQAQERLWIYRDYRALLAEKAKEEGKSLNDVAAIYGELGVPIDIKKNKTAEFTYSNQLGLVKRKPPE
jgi:CRISPR-associated endonuclease/helicase Cas3